MPTFTPNRDYWVKLDGRGATLVLSREAPRALDARRLADYDTFRNLWIDGLQIDAAFEGGDHHVIFGNRISRSKLYTQRVRFENIIITNIHAYDILTSYSAEANARTGIAIEMMHPSSAEPTSSFARNILIDGIRIDGGNNGVMIVGTSDDGTRSPNIALDNVLISDTSHQLDADPGTGFPSSNFHIGSFARVGYVVIGSCTGRAAGDNGIEVDNAAFAVLHGNVMMDQANVAYFMTNFHPDVDTGSQRILLLDNDALVTEQHRVAGYGRGFFVWGGPDAPPVGNVHFLDNTFRSLSPDVGAFALGVYGRVAAVSIARLVVDYASLVFENTAPEWHNVVIVENELPGARLDIRTTDLNYNLSIAQSTVESGGSAFPYLLFIAGDRMTVDLDEIRISVSAVGLDRPSAGRIHALYLGGAPNLPSGRSRLSGRIARLSIRSLVGDEDPVGIRLGSFLDVDPTLTFVDCDLSTLPDASTAFVMDAGLGNASGVFCTSVQGPPTLCSLASNYRSHPPH